MDRYLIDKCMLNVSELGVRRSALGVVFLRRESHEGEAAGGQSCNSSPPYPARRRIGGSMRRLSF